MTDKIHHAIVYTIVSIILIVSMIIFTSNAVQWNISILAALVYGVIAGLVVIGFIALVIFAILMSSGK